MNKLKFETHKYFKTEARLKTLLDSSAPEVDALINSHLEAIYEIDLELSLEETKGDLEFWGYNELLDTLENCPDDTSKLCYQYVNSIWSGSNFGEYKYIGNIALSPELEFQADDGGLAYYYLGYPSLEIYEFTGKRAE